MAVPFSPHDLYVSTEGDDRWSGQLPEPAASRADGPFATLARARDAVRALRQAGRWPGPLTVWLRGGRYQLDGPLTFTSDDSAPVTYAACPGERPILDGGERIPPSAWRVEQRGGLAAWVADLSAWPEERRRFRQLFVNGARRPRARLPKVGPEPGRRTFYRMASVPGLSFPSDSDDPTVGWSQWTQHRNAFICEPGDVQNWPHLQDVEVVALHYWIEERMPVVAFDEATRLVTCARLSNMTLTDDFNPSMGTRYYLDNVFEALSEPGEWFLERDGRLHYLPLPGETPETAEAFVPRAEQLLKLEGAPDQGRFVEYLRFIGLTFQHTEWRQPEGPYASAGQAASGLPGAIALTGARHCAFEGCAVEHIGYYAFDIGDGCHGIRLAGNRLFDLGAGGVKLGGAGADGPVSRRTGHCRITDNTIHACGRVFHAGVGILARHTFDNDLSHNHIHDLFYTAISCGWVWGYADSVSKNNRIEKNHLHDIGHAWLSDMGGIYLLGVAPGTVVRGNLIHDVERAAYGGWGVYLDEGSSHVLVEDNLCYRLGSQPFHQHYGRENVIRNNLFACGQDAQIALSRAESHLSFTFERNIVVTGDQPVYIGGYRADMSQRNFVADLNLIWSTTGAPLRSGNGANGCVDLVKAYDWDQWRSFGNDTHSVVADPRFADLAGLDFRLEAGSPALALGFRPFDVSDAGPRTGPASGGG